MACGAIAIFAIVCLSVILFVMARTLGGEDFASVAGSRYDPEDSLQPTDEEVGTIINTAFGLTLRRCSLSFCCPVEHSCCPGRSCCMKDKVSTALRCF